MWQVKNNFVLCVNFVKSIPSKQKKSFCNLSKADVVDEIHLWQVIFIHGRQYPNTRKIYRKLRVGTKIRSTFFWFLTCYRAAEIVQNDYLSSPWNFRSKEYHHALYWKFGTLAGLGSRPQVQMIIGSIQKKTFLVLRPFEGALTCSILIAGTQVMLRKAFFLRRGS
jgi:hypothetical protein